MTIETTEPDGDEPLSASTASKIVAPLLALGAAWAVRKALDAAYLRSTGSTPPQAANRDEPLRRVLLWAAATAAVLAVVKVAIDRITAPRPPEG